LTCTVQKFGGTTVATLERIKHAADIVARSRRNGNDVIAVVSAMAGVTNKFVGYVRNLNACEGDPEYDGVVSSGELITAGLMAIALKNLGLKARSYASWQVPIFTDECHGHAVIREIDPRSIKKDVKNGVIPVICGFQGVSPSNRITTLGRGGSDLTAVAVAAAVSADLCEIYSDVDGVYTVDPNLYPAARKICAVNYDEMLEMASRGAKILQEQSVDYAMKHKVVIRVASSFIDNGGTLIAENVPPVNFRGLAVTPGLLHVRVSHEGPPDRIIDLLEKNFIRAEMLKGDDDGKLDLLADKKKGAVVLSILKNCEDVRSVKQIVVRRPYSRISVVGTFASAETAEVPANILREKKTEALTTSSSNRRASLIVPSDKLQESIALLHKYCGLEK
jgi:aspartate kinase